MLSLTVNSLKPFSSFNPTTTWSTSTTTFLSSTSFLNPYPPPLLYHKPSSPKPISATLTPSSSSQQQQQQVYQPFRPPPSPIPSKFRSLDANGRLEILANRLGLWFEYAPLIPSLTQEGFTPPTIEEITGISSVEQNRLVVAAQVRDSLVQSNTDPEIVSEFDLGGSELLYEIRLLSVQQRAAAARFIIENKLDAKGAQDLARSMKDFPRRRTEKGWKSFDYASAGDCLGFMYFRQGREHKNPSEPRTAALEQALKVARTDKAKKVILKELEGESEDKEEEDVAVGVRVPVVRLKFGEVAESTKVVILPVCRAEEKDKEVMEAPWECRSEGELGVMVAEKGWKRWVVLPGWEPVVSLGKGGVVVSFSDARVLPWKVNRWYKEEPILVVADRSKREVEVEADDGFYLAAVDGEGLGFKVVRGSALKAAGAEESLGTVVLIVRPPRDETDDQLSEEDWE